jgi:hypothetical protein
MQKNLKHIEKTDNMLTFSYVKAYGCFFEAACSLKNLRWIIALDFADIQKGQAFTRRKPAWFHRKLFF